MCAAAIATLPALEKLVPWGRAAVLLLPRQRLRTLAQAALTGCTGACARPALRLSPKERFDLRHGCTTRSQTLVSGLHSPAR